ncbi:hypothetical protein C8Q75DRAFT_790700 [Abortiporus biennis]|nr:hypothetical protein C8Q75DRAFT_790700 [Abortiporus biennis]
MPSAISFNNQFLTLSERENLVRVESPLSSLTSSSDEGDEEELELLTPQGSCRDLDTRILREHEISTAPLVTRAAFVAAGGQKTFPQRGVLGQLLDYELYINTNAPFSTLVCGVQGSGKSHTVSLMLENMLITECASIGRQRKPLSGLVLHFGEGGTTTLPSEAAWIAVADQGVFEAPRVRVFVSKSSLNTMKAVYAPLGDRVTVSPLLFTEGELDAQAFLTMMAVGSTESAPLYIQTILSILRSLGESFTVEKFMTKLEQEKKNLLPTQLTALKQRMALLESFIDKKSIKSHQFPPDRFTPGELTIIDLSDPFVDPAAACNFFEVITRAFVRADLGTGKVLLVDEAHKYLSAQNGGSGLTKELLSLIRQQRHYAMRVIISTQEPTVVPPVLIDLCTVTILHRFSSPAWWEHVAKHVSANMTSTEAFDRVVRLQVTFWFIITGHAIVLAPTALRDRVRQFGRAWMLVATRRRVTKDGGASIMVVN